MARDADAGTIRAAYRRRAREHHPDHVRHRDANGVRPDEMAAINEAYRVLGDPARRVVYDRGLVGFPAGSSAARATHAPTTSVPTVDATPARIPWRFMGGMAAVGVAVVVAGALLTDPPSPDSPDGILRSGSCVTIEVNGDAREVPCTGEGDLVVRQLVPIDARCPVGTAGHRDRLGLGTACVVAPPAG